MWTWNKLVSTFGYTTSIRGYQILVDCWNIIGDRYEEPLPKVYLIEDEYLDKALEVSRFKLTKPFYKYKGSGKIFIGRKSKAMQEGTAEWFASLFGMPKRGDQDFDWMESWWKAILTYEVDYDNKTLRLTSKEKYLPEGYCTRLLFCENPNGWNIINGNLSPPKVPKSRGVYGVYINDKLVYIGMTWTQDFKARWSQHQRNFEIGSSALHLYSLTQPNDKIEYKILIDVSEIKLSEGVLDKRDVQMMELALIREHRPAGNLSGNTMEYKL